MPETKTKIIFGPNDTQRLLTAGAIKKVHRIQVEITSDDAGVITDVVAYPIDEQLIEISGIVNYRINGCPYPPDCTTVEFIKESSNAADCRIKIANNAKTKNIV